MVIETKEREVESIEKPEGQAERSGYTRITSVSVTDDLYNLIKAHNLSPTEIFRRGVAVSLAELGVPPYNNSLNIRRIEELKSFYELEEYKQLFKMLEAFFNNEFKIMKEIIERMEDEE